MNDLNATQRAIIGFELTRSTFGGAAQYHLPLSSLLKLSPEQPALNWAVALTEGYSDAIVAGHDPSHTCPNIKPFHHAGDYVAMHQLGDHGTLSLWQSYNSNDVQLHVKTNPDVSFPPVQWSLIAILRNWVAGRTALPVDLDRVERMVLPHLTTEWRDYYISQILPVVSA